MEVSLLLLSPRMRSLSLRKEALSEGSPYLDSNLGTTGLTGHQCHVQNHFEGPVHTGNVSEREELLLPFLNDHSPHTLVVRKSTSLSPVFNLNFYLVCLLLR